MSQALDLLIEGKFEPSAEEYQRDLAQRPEHIPTRSGFASALMGANRFNQAIAHLWAVHEHTLREVPDTCGRLVDLACAYWCIDDRPRAIELAHGLVAGSMAGKVNMAPDLAGGCSFGLLLYYMAVTVGIDEEREYALAFLRKLKVKYDKNPRFFGFPKMSVQQFFGDATFEDALESGTGVRSLDEAREIARTSRARMSDLSVVLFNDASFRRGQGDEAGAWQRMREVFDLGYWAEPIYWYLARHEVSGRQD